MLITYGDSIIADDQTPLQTLDGFLRHHVGDAITSIHVLPFYPYTSDDGFAVSDYTAVRDDLGDWSDIHQLASHHDLMFDLVINHVSASHAWFEQFQRDQSPGNQYFITCNPQTDLHDVTRPRSSPLLRETRRGDATVHVWCTFGHDQVDLNFANPDLMVEMIGVAFDYINHGASWLRLDAIGYLWKQIGTSCIHLPQTHEAVRLMRTLVEFFAPHVRLITETNVPNNENLSYFGNRNEAHLIYNFSLAPLILHALLSGVSRALVRWMRSMPPAPVGCTFLNFTASHDGIGMRPAEGLLSDEEQSRVIDAVRDRGGLLSMRRMADGTDRVYEMNVSLFDALGATFAGPDNYHIPRFLCSQTIPMGIEGVPAIYIHSLLATPNDLDGVAETGRNRSINRHRWDRDRLEGLLADPDSAPHQVHAEMCRRLRIRANQPAFDPKATQFTLILNPHFFGFWRQSIDRTQSIFAVHNLSNQTRTLSLEDLNLTSTDQWYDLISGEAMPGLYDEIDVAPYQCLWITNRLNNPVDENE